MTSDEHTIRVNRRSKIAALDYVCEKCGDIRTTPRGFSEVCDGDAE